MSRIEVNINVAKVVSRELLEISERVGDIRQDIVRDYNNIDYRVLKRSAKLEMRYERVMRTMIQLELRYRRLFNFYQESLGEYLEVEARRSRGSRFWRDLMGRGSNTTNPFSSQDMLYDLGEQFLKEIAEQAMGVKSFTVLSLFDALVYSERTGASRTDTTINLLNALVPDSALNFVNNWNYALENLFRRPVGNAVMCSSVTADIKYSNQVAIHNLLKELRKM